MAAVSESSRSRGLSVLEILLSMSIVLTLAAISVPVSTGVIDDMRTAMAARYVEGRMMHARATAVRRSTPTALRFEPLDNDYLVGEYFDGNGNGVRSTDIASRIDPALAPRLRVSDLFPGVRFGLQPGLPDVDGSRSTGTDGVRVGSSRILTFGPDGTATSGTLYLTGRRRQYAVRVLGATGRTRVLMFHPGAGRWITP